MSQRDLKQMPSPPKMPCPECAGQIEWTPIEGESLCMLLCQECRHCFGAIHDDEEDGAARRLALMTDDYCTSVFINEICDALYSVAPFNLRPVHGSCLFQWIDGEEVIGEREIVFPTIEAAIRESVIAQYGFQWVIGYVRGAIEQRGGTVTLDRIETPGRPKEDWPK